MSIPISIVIPVWKGGATFIHCLNSLAKLDPAPLEIIIVLDGSDVDKSGDAARRAGFKVIGYNSRKGPASARNYGASIANGDILLFLDADVAAPRQLVGRVWEYFLRFPKMSALIGSYDDDPGSLNFLSQYKNLFHHYVHQNSSTQASTFWGALGAIRKSIFISMGGFCEEYNRPSIEDIELGYRLTAAGHLITMAPEIQVKHLKKWTIASLIRTDIFYRAIPWTHLILQTRHMPDDLNLNMNSKISALLVPFLLFCLALSFYWPRAFWLSAFTVLTLIMLNAQLYSFFLHKRGLSFLFKAIPWHWTYYFYSTLGFFLGYVAHTVGRFPKYY